MSAWPYAVLMASMAATATGFRTSDTTPRTFTAPCCCNTFASPITVASSHQRDRSVSMITRGPVAPDAGALTVGAPGVDGPGRDADPDEPEEHPPDAIATSMAATTIAPVDATRRYPPRSSVGGKFSAPAPASTSPPPVW